MVVSSTVREKSATLPCEPTWTVPRPLAEAAQAPLDLSPQGCGQRSPEGTEKENSGCPADRLEAAVAWSQTWELNDTHMEDVFTTPYV